MSAPGPREFPWAQQPVSGLCAKPAPFTTERRRCSTSVEQWRPEEGWRDRADGHQVTFSVTGVGSRAVEAPTVTELPPTVTLVTVVVPPAVTMVRV